MPTLPSFLVRDATTDDMSAMTSVYAGHVLHGCGSFEETPPDLAEMTARYAKVRDLQLPWLVAVMDGEVAGFAYASLYRPRAAYRFTVEDSVYIAAHLGGRGIGSALLEALIVRCQQQSFQQMLANVGDGYRNTASVSLHKKMGFEVVGHLRAVGFKHDEWRDTLLMQRALNPHINSTPD